MIDAQQVIDLALAEARRLGRADETVVVVTDRVDATLRWANNTMTTNGESTSRATTFISIARQGGPARVGSVRSSSEDPKAIAGLVAASQHAAAAAPPATDAAPPLPAVDVPRDWDAPIPGTGADVFLGAAAELAQGFRSASRSGAALFGYARHAIETTFVATSGGLRRRFTQPTGAVEINAKRDGASVWAGLGTPDFNSVPIDSMLDELDTRLSWSRRTIELPADRYETIMPPSTVADMMIYLAWTMSGRGAQEGRTALAAPGRGTRVGERLTALPLTLYSDPWARGLECAPFIATPSSSERASVFDNGMAIDRVDWIREGVINALAYPRAAAAEFDAPVAVGADNLLMTAGLEKPPGLQDMIAETERGLLLTTLWYIREVDPSVLLLTGLTRDGVYLVEDGAVTAAVNNFRFNESPLDLLRRATQAGVSEITLPREWGDWATRAQMPALRIPDFRMSSVSQAQ
ncbi:MAG: TldD/PmbA family protein [Actinomycetia bacterium]|nr:TldD/PmbA family protein [Actinomycetes bacterium]